MSSLSALELFEEYAKTYIATLKSGQSELSAVLVEAIEYALLSGGKRYRPSLGLSLAESFGVHPKVVLPWLLAVEMIHTYSLIHDDLPAMDDDDFRRGKPTAHKVFGEDIALLAGDALASEAFYMISKNYKDRPEIALRLVHDLSLAMGPLGMVKGQVIDLQSKKTHFTQEAILEMHRLKTGALIKVTLVGVSKLLGLPEARLSDFSDLGDQIGLAFQLKDDLLDSAEAIEPGSLPACIGLEATHSLLNECHQKIQSVLDKLNVRESSFARLTEFNYSREI